MTPLSVIITIAAYFAILFTVSYIAEGRQTMPASLWVTVSHPGMSWRLPWSVPPFRV